MMLNSERLSVEEWDEQPEPRPTGLCPGCKGELVAKRGPIVVWHWSHKSASCGHSAGETAWHLAWKKAFAQIDGMVVEEKVAAGGRLFFADVLDARCGQVFEFVNSWSPSYEVKHAALRSKFVLPTVWVLHGEAFESALAGKDGHGRLTHMLKPSAYEFAREKLHSVFVHHDGALWQQDKMRRLEKVCDGSLLEMACWLESGGRRTTPRKPLPKMAVREHGAVDVGAGPGLFDEGGPLAD